MTNPDTLRALAKELCEAKPLKPRCPRCEDWERKGLSATCPSCDAAALLAMAERKERDDG